MRMPTVNVSKIRRVYAEPLALKRTQRALAPESIRTASEMMTP
jgi:hypothetical protein